MTTTAAVADLRTPAGLRAWRNARGLTQGELGDLLEVTWTSVNRWENGRHAIPRSVELALLYIADHPELLGHTTPAPLTPADRLVAELATESGHDAAWFRATQLAADLDNAADGDKRALIRIRKACGLPAFKPS